MAPKVVCFDRAGKAQLPPGDGNRSRRMIVEVEKSNEEAAAGVVGGPYLLAAETYRMSRLAGLVCGDDLGIGQQLKAGWVEPGEVVAGIERGALDGPERHHGLALRVGEAVHGAVADIQRVEIVPTFGGACVLVPPCCRLKTRFYLRPTR